MSGALPRDAYRDLVDQVRDCIRLHVPPRSVVLIASKGDEELVRLDAHRAWHFPQAETGVYAGHHPADSAEAIAHLHDLQVRGAEYLVFPSTALWWLDYYGDLATHLNTCHKRRIAADGVCVIYELDPSAVSDSERDGPESVRGSTAGSSVEPTPLIRLAVTGKQPVRRVLSILARYGTSAYRDAEGDIAEIFARQMPSIDRTAIIVDNSLPPAFVEKRRDSVVIGGNNSAREFSAFERAVEFVGSEIWSYDLVHFATSAFKTLYTAYLERFTAELVAGIAGRPVCVGHVDCYNDPIDVLSFRSQHWIRSCFFVLPPAEVKALGRLATVADGSEWFSGDAAQPFRVDAPLSGNFRDYLTTWLTGGDIGQGVEWHSSFAITPETLPAFEHKAVSILNEHLLSVRLRALGCHLIDVTWLSTLLRRQSAADIPWSTPWREQLASRDSGAVQLPQGYRAVALSGV